MWFEVISTAWYSAFNTLQFTYNPQRVHVNIKRRLIYVKPVQSPHSQVFQNGGYLCPISTSFHLLISHKFSPSVLSHQEGGLVQPRTGQYNGKFSTFTASLRRMHLPGNENTQPSSRKRWTSRNKHTVPAPPFSHRRSSYTKMKSHLEKEKCQAGQFILRPFQGRR